MLFKHKIISIVTLSIVTIGLVVLTLSMQSHSNNVDDDLKVKDHMNADDNELTKEEVITWVKEQSEHKTDYYKEFEYELVNLDSDTELEIIAKNIGGVHLGNFYIFDMNEEGKPELIADEKWHVSDWNVMKPMMVGGKKIFEVIDRTGGTGVDVLTSHLWYIENGEFIKAWDGILKSRSTYKDDYNLKMGSYQFNEDNNLLYTWLSSYLYDADGVNLKKIDGTETIIYTFDGTRFVESLTNMTPKTQPTGATPSNRLTDTEKQEIKQYINRIYNSHYVEAVPVFEHINQANEDWIWRMASEYLVQTKGMHEFTSDEVEKTSKILYGDHFSKKIAKSSSRLVKYLEEDNKYCIPGMSVDMVWDYIIKTVIKQENQYTIEIVEYMESYEMGLNPVEKVILNSEYEEITSFPLKYFSASNDEEMKLLEEESETIKAKAKDFVFKNADQFHTKELVIERNEKTGLLHIAAVRNK